MQKTADKYKTSQTQASKPGLFNDFAFDTQDVPMYTIKRVSKKNKDGSVTIQQVVPRAFSPVATNSPKTDVSQFSFGLPTFEYWTQDMMQSVKLWKGFEDLLNSPKRKFPAKRNACSPKLKAVLLQNNDINFINEQLNSLNQQTPSFWIPTVHQNTIKTLASYERIKTIEALCQNWIEQLTNAVSRITATPRPNRFQTQALQSNEIKAVKFSKESFSPLKRLSATLNAQILTAYQKLLLTIMDSDKSQSFQIIDKPKSLPEDLPEILECMKKYMKNQPYIPKAVIHSTYEIILQASLFQASQ